jgi:hypothetical protein
MPPFSILTARSWKNITTTQPNIWPTILRILEEPDRVITDATHAATIQPRKDMSDEGLKERTSTCSSWLTEKPVEVAADMTRASPQDVADASAAKGIDEEVPAIAAEAAGSPNAGATSSARLTAFLPWPFVRQMKVKMRATPETITVKGLEPVPCSAATSITTTTTAASGVQRAAAQAANKVVSTLECPRNPVSYGASLQTNNAQTIDVAPRMISGHSQGYR